MTLTECKTYLQNTKLILSVLGLFILTAVLLYEVVGIIGIFAAPQKALSESIANSIYTDSLSNNWENWSWNASVNLNNTDPISSGTKSISAAIGPWGGVYLHSTN